MKQIDVVEFKYTDNLHPELDVVNINSKTYIALDGLKTIFNVDDIYKTLKFADIEYVSCHVGNTWKTCIKHDDLPLFAVAMEAFVTEHCNYLKEAYLAINDRMAYETEKIVLEKRLAAIEAEIAEVQQKIRAAKVNSNAKPEQRKKGFSYADDFKNEIIDYCANGGTIKGAARHFKVARNTVRKYIRSVPTGESVNKSELASNLSKADKARVKKHGEVLLSSEVQDSDIREQWRTWIKGMISKIAFKIHDGDSILNEDHIRKILWGQLYDKLSEKFKIDFKKERANLRRKKPRAAYLDVIGLKAKENANVLEEAISIIKQRADANSVDYQVVGLKKLVA